MPLFGIREPTTSLLAATALKSQSNFSGEHETYKWYTQSKYYPANRLISEEGQKQNGYSTLIRVVAKRTRPVKDFCHRNDG